MNGNQRDEYISTASNEAIFRETARRLRQMYFNDTNSHFDFGSFEFVFEDGRFIGIDECQRQLLYRASLRPRPVPA